MPKEIEGEVYYTTNEVETLFNLDPVTVMDLIMEKKVTAKKMDDEWLISAASIKEYFNMEERQT
jgi:hypothetical protein